MAYLSRAIVVLLVSLLFLSQPAQANSPLSVVINEIAWMGREASSNDEWLELYNNTDIEINLSGWKLLAKDGGPEINLLGIIATGGFFLLERTDDETLPNISADQIYTGALGNTGEFLNLYDGSGNLIDFVDCSSGWFAGDNSTKQTMERKNPKASGSDNGNWTESKESTGTPKMKNSSFGDYQQAQEEPPIKENQPQVETKPPLITASQEELKIYPSGIIINEILPSPIGPDETEEWIEIFNENLTEINLSDWKITDTIGGTKTYIFPESSKIPAQGFLILSRPTTKITLNNDEDGLSLFTPHGEIVETINYLKAPQGQSYSREKNEWFWSTGLTPGSANIITDAENSNKKDILERSAEDAIKTKNELASLGEQLPKSSKSLLVFLSAFGISILCGLIILIIKKKLTR